MFEFIKQLLDWIYRNNCYFCRKPVQSGLMCTNCYKTIELNFPEPVKVLDGINVYSASLYVDNLRKLVRGLKYHNKKELAVPFALILFSIWQELDFDKDNFEIIPMPLHYEREKKRGYNHIELVAQELSKLTGYSVNSEIVIRNKNTKAQYGLSKKERIENIKGAFKVFPEKSNGKKLLIIDDLCMSGATLNELITCLKQKGIVDLYVLVAAVPESASVYQH